MDIKQTWKTSLEDGYLDITINRFRGIYALNVQGVDDFIIATEGDWITGYSRTGRMVYFTVQDNVYINGREAYIFLTSKRKPDKSLTVTISQESMAYGFDFISRSDEDETSELDRISRFTQYVGIENVDNISKIYESKSELKPFPEGHRGSNDKSIEILELPFDVYGGRRRCYVSAITQYYINDVNKDVRVAYDNGIRASIVTSSKDDGHTILTVTNFGKSYLARKVYYIIRITHLDNSNVYCEVKISYSTDGVSTLEFDAKNKDLKFDGNGGQIDIRVNNRLNYSASWSTDTDSSWVECINGPEGVLIKVSQYVLSPDDTVSDRKGIIKLLDGKNKEVDNINVIQTPIVLEKNDNGGGEEIPPTNDEDVWQDKDLNTLTPNPSNAQVILQLSASWVTAKYDSGNHRVELSQDDNDKQYPFLRKCRLLVKNANNLSEILAFNVIQNGETITTDKVSLVN